MKVNVKAKGGHDFDRFLQVSQDLDLTEFAKSASKKALIDLINQTNVDTGITASSWSTEVYKTGSVVGIDIFNDRILNNGVPLVILLDKGHGTGTGGYVPGRHFIRPIVSQMIDPKLLMGVINNGR